MISSYFSNEEILSQLRAFIGDVDDLNACLSQIEDIGDDKLQITYKGRTFIFDSILCNMEEVE